MGSEVLICVIPQLHYDLLKYFADCAINLDKNHFVMFKNVPGVASIHNFRHRHFSFARFQIIFQFFRCTFVVLSGFGERVNAAKRGWNVFPSFAHRKSLPILKEHLSS